MPAVLDLSALGPPVLLAVAVGLILVQTALVVGFLVPAGKAAVLAGALAGTGHLALGLVFGLLATAAALGAGFGYLIGRRYGDAVFEHRLLARHGHRVSRARDLVQRRAGFSLLAGRSLAVFRATTPALAGAVGVAPRTFVFFNLVGAVAWATVFVGSGYAGGRILPGLSWNGTTALAVGGAVVLVVVVAVLLRRRSQERVHSSCQPSTEAAGREAGPV